MVGCCVVDGVFFFSRRRPASGVFSCSLGWGVLKGPGLDHYKLKGKPRSDSKLEENKTRFPSGKKKGDSLKFPIGVNLSLIQFDGGGRSILCTCGCPRVLE